VHVTAHGLRYFSMDLANLLIMYHYTATAVVQSLTLRTQ